MITLDREHSDIFPLKCILDHLTDYDGVVCALDLSIVPYVMGRIISSPEHHVWAQFSFDVVKHGLECWNG